MSFHLTIKHEKKNSGPGKIKKSLATDVQTFQYSNHLFFAYLAIFFVLLIFIFKSFHLTCLHLHIFCPPTQTKKFDENLCQNRNIFAFYKIFLLHRCFNAKKISLSNKNGFATIRFQKQILLHKRFHTPKL